MQPLGKIAHSRLLYADFISDMSEEMEIIKKIKNHGFTASAQKDNILIKFSTDDPGKFIGQLQSVCKYDTILVQAYWVICWKRQRILAQFAQKIPLQSF